MVPCGSCTGSNHLLVCRVSSNRGHGIHDKRHEESSTSLSTKGKTHTTTTDIQQRRVQPTPLSITSRPLIRNLIPSQPRYSLYKLRRIPPIQPRTFRSELHMFLRNMLSVLTQWSNGIHEGKDLLVTQLTKPSKWIINFERVPYSSADMRESASIIHRY
jgi:hypothetical protein